MRDEEIVELLKKDNDEFRRLYQEHRELDNQLTELSRKHYLTPEEEVEEKRIKKEKLHRKDRIAEMIREYRKQASPS
ncbi:MAG: YdcH family protein [Chloroflexota bacterium]|jgi:uncharacterized protein